MDFYVKNISGVEIQVKFTLPDGNQIDDIFGPNEKIKIDSKKLKFFNQILDLVKIQTFPFEEINWIEEGF